MSNQRQRKKMLKNITHKIDTKREKILSIFLHLIAHDFLRNKYLLTIPRPKVPLSLPAPKRECGIFGLGMMKNRIPAQHVGKEGHPDLGYFRLVWQFTRALDWPTLYLYCCVIYYLKESTFKLKLYLPTF